ncbi:polysaccharide deacetylase family protein [Propionibacteriaceae bacterium G57]|uniref:polysaccharide deacetylase family protein n=1 Tax=Aestuariimicrobium sp. G57 TaxID=3418485 RepID=UPI003DA75F16
MRSARHARRFRSIGAVVTALVLVVGLTACSKVGTTTPRPTGTSVAQPTSAAPTPAPDAVFARPDPKLLASQSAQLNVDGLSVTSLLVTHELPGLAMGLDIVRGQVLRQRAWAGGGNLTVTPELVASSGKAVGVALCADGDAGRHTAVVWYDPTTNSPWASPVLVAPAQWQALTAAVAALSGDQKDAALAQLAEPSWPNGNGPAIAFNASGDLVVQFQTIDGLALTPVLIAGDEAQPMLTEFGTRARAASRYPTPATAPQKFADPDPTLVGRPPAPDHKHGKKKSTEPTTPAPSTTPSSTPVTDARPQLVLGVDCEVKKCVAITYDDGPVPQTVDLLKVLNERKVPATFFVLGTSADNYPDVVTTTAAMGMQVASHNQVHHQMSATSGAKLDAQVSRSATTLRRLTGQDPLFLRPPYGAHNKASDAVVGKHGMAVALWSVDTLDWKFSTKSQDAAQAEILRNIRAQGGNGAVVLMHDIHANSRASAPAVIDALQAEGYTLVTLAELAPQDYRFGRPFCKSPAVAKHGCGS